MQTPPPRPLYKSVLAALVLLGGAGSSAIAHAQTAAPVPPAAPSPVSGGGQNEAVAGGLLCSGDTVNILVAGEASMSGSQRIAADGTVTLPLAGQIKVVGDTSSAASAKIAGVIKTKKLIRSPQVSVFFVARAERTVFISGALTTQGRMVITDTTTLNEIVEPAGILPTANLKRVTIVRGDKKMVVNYAAYRTGNDAPESPNNPHLADGDKIYVQAQTQAAGGVKINGEVKNPQVIPLTDGMTLMQAIQQAGGVSDFANRDAVSIVRGGKDIAVSFKQIQEGQKDKDLPLLDKDEIFVRRREKPPVYYVNGGVTNRNTFPLVGTVTLSDAIAAAGGVLDQVNKKKIVVQHKTAGGQVVARVYDLTQSADASAVIQPEDIVAVPYPTEKQPKRDPLSLLGAAGTLLLFFRH